MTQPAIILASASPRRREILAQMGVPFIPHPTDADERALPGEEPEAHVLRLARAKARAAGDHHATGLVLGADTVVVLDGVIVGKPDSADQARRYLDRLRGRAHRVVTGVAILHIASGRIVDGAVWTEVWLRAFSDTERDAYIATGDPMDKAGAYAIQHPTFHPVDRIVGSETNVIGLPVELVERLLAEVGASKA